MWKRLVEALKGDTHSVDFVARRITYEGSIPAVKHWPIEAYRLHVYVHRVTTSRDAFWVKPSTRLYYVVDPMTSHRIPVDVRSKTIYVLDNVGKQRFDDAIGAADAVHRYLQIVLNGRMAAFQKDPA